MEMSQRIKERRLAMKYTQEELAVKLGLQKSAIAKYENGRVENIKRSVIQKMAAVLECSPSYLMGWDDSVTLKHSVSLRPDESNLLGNYNLLNDNGKDKAQEYVSDLTDNRKYTDDVWLNAAHQRTDTELSGTSHDDDIMDDPDEWE